MKILWKAVGIAAIYIGTVIGAGFASGQEIWQFFTRFGQKGSLGLVLSTILLMYLGSKSMLWGLRIKAQSYRDFMYQLAGGWMGKAGDWTMTVFLFFLTGIMLAGAGAVAVQQGLRWEVGCWGTVVCAVFILRHRLEGIRGVNMIVIPMLFLTAIMLNIKGVPTSVQTKPLIISGNLWFMAACQYSGYNLFLSLPVLVTLHHLESNPVVLKCGGILGGFSLGVLAFLFHLAIMQIDSSVLELPLMIIIKGWGRSWGWIYAFVLWGELFSTLLAHTFGLATRMEFVNSKWYLLQISLLLSLAVVISWFGFARLVEVIYPIFGLISIMLLIPLGIIPLPLPGVEKKSNRKYRIFTV